MKISKLADSTEKRTILLKCVCVFWLLSLHCISRLSGKIDCPCYRFLADKSPYNRLISYYQQPQTLKLIFIGVKKEVEEIPRGSFDLYGSHLLFETFFSCVCVCVETPGGTPTSLMESHLFGMSKVMGTGFSLKINLNCKMLSCSRTREVCQGKITQIIESISLTSLTETQCRSIVLVSQRLYFTANNQTFLMKPKKAVGFLQFTALTTFF